jgi:hypothetical protein
MADINRRIERMERLVGDVDCVCAKTRSALLVIDDDSSEEQKSGEASVSFVCPTHGVQLHKSILRISSVDVNL